MTSSLPRFSCQFSSSRSGGFERYTFRTKTDQCFNFKGFGHHESQCPSKFLGLAGKKSREEDDIEEEGYKPSIELILETGALEEEETKARAKIGFVGLLHHMLAMQKTSPMKLKKKKIASYPLQPAPHI